MTHSTLTGSSAGDFFHRLGIAEAWALDILAAQGAAATTNSLVAGSTPTRIAALQVDLAAATADYDTAQLFQQAADAFQGSPGSFLSSVQSALQGMLVTACNKDTPLSALNVPQAVQFLVACMVADSALINFGTLPAVGAQTAAVGVTPVGNPTFAWSAKDAVGRGLQYVVPETITALISQDSQNGAPPGSEPYNVVGQNAQTNFLSWDWLKSSKYGSGANASGQIVDPTVSNTSSTGGANLLVNSTFTTFTTTNQADNWTYAVGVATTDFVNGTSSNAYFSGQGSLGMLSAGGVKNAVTQAFNTAVTPTVGAGGTPYVLVSSAINNTQYGVWVAVKLSTGSPSNGTLTVDLITGDGTVSGSTTTEDDETTANTFAIDLTLLTDTNWHIFTGAFRMPQALPTVPVKLRLAFTGTILDAGKTAYVNAGMSVMSQFYAGGPYYTAFRGSTDVLASGGAVDSWTFAVTATIGKIQRAMWRWFNIPTIPAQPGQNPQSPGIIIPAVTSGSATIADSLVA